MQFSVCQFNGELCFYKTGSPDTNCHTYHTKILRREGDEKTYPPLHKPPKKPNQNQSNRLSILTCRCCTTDEGHKNYLISVISFLQKLFTSVWFAVRSGQWAERLKPGLPGLFLRQVWGRPWCWAELRRGRCGVGRDAPPKALSLRTVGSPCPGWCHTSSFPISPQCPYVVGGCGAGSDSAVLWLAVPLSPGVMRPRLHSCIPGWNTHCTWQHSCAASLPCLVLAVHSGAWGAAEHWRLHGVWLSALWAELPQSTPCLCTSLHGSLFSCSWQLFQVMRVSLMLCELHPILRCFPMPAVLACATWD